MRKIPIFNKKFAPLPKIPGPPPTFYGTVPKHKIPDPLQPSTVRKSKNRKVTENSGISPKTGWGARVVGGWWLTGGVQPTISPQEDRRLCLEEKKVANETLRLQLEVQRLAESSNDAPRIHSWIPQPPERLRNPDTKSDKKEKERGGRRGWKGGRKGGGARSDQKERDRIFINVRAPNFAGKVSDENLKVNQKTGWAKRGRFFVSA